MSTPPCLCKVEYQFADAKFPATVKHCAFHAAAGDLFEVLEAIMGQAEQVVHHRGCRCLSCRGIKALFKARGTSAPMAKSAVAGAGAAQDATKGKS